MWNVSADYTKPSKIKLKILCKACVKCEKLCELRENKVNISI